MMAPQSPSREKKKVLQANFPKKSFKKLSQEFFATELLSNLPPCLVMVLSWPCLVATCLLVWSTNETASSPSSSSSFPQWCSLLPFTLPKPSPLSPFSPPLPLSLLFRGTRAELWGAGKSGNRCRVSLPPPVLYPRFPPRVRCVPVCRFCCTYAQHYNYSARRAQCEYKGGGAPRTDSGA